jgi:hypothetical protein
MLVCAAVVAIAVLPPVVAAAAQPPFEFAVRQDRFLGGTSGTLVIHQDGIEFRTTDRKRARRWDYEALKQVRILSPTRVTLETYEDRGRLRFGADRAYAFEVPGSVPESAVAFLLDRLDRPMVTAVMPPLPATALFRVAVKNASSRKGSDGTLLLYETGIAYVTEREGQARFWRVRDVYGVLALDRYRLQVLAYEGGSGETRPFTFELKTDLPPGMFDAIWQRVNSPIGRNQAPANDQRKHRSPDMTRTNHILTLGLGAALTAAAVFEVPTVTAEQSRSNPPQVTVTLATRPSPPVTGDNDFEVTVQVDARPLAGADVSLLLVMPAMPEVGMPEMRNTIALRPAEGGAADEGKYAGRGQVMMAGTWNVTVSVTVANADVVEKKLTLVAR